MVSIAIVKYLCILLMTRLVQEHSDMSRLARIFGAIRHPRRARPSPRDCGTDRPVSSAELVAASAFLDFGGMPSGDWLHAWEASLERDCRLKSEELALVMVMPQRTAGNKNIGEGFDREKPSSIRVGQSMRHAI
jgi:hypothetical protein